MGTYVNNNRVDLGTEYDYDDAVREIGGLLGVGPREDGMYRLADIGTSQNIAMWAKNKPFVKVNKSTRFNAATAAERRAANYGLQIPYATSPVTLKNNYYNQANDTIKNNGWKMRLPSGGDAEPVRLRDFNGYWHEAPCPFTRLTLPTNAMNTWETSKIQIALPISSGSSETAGIRMTDIVEIADGYFTVQLRHTNPTGNGIYYRTISAEKTFAESDGGSVTISTHMLPKGDWDIIPFISPVRFTEENDGSQVPASYRYYPIPRCYAGNLEISEVEYALVYFDGFKNVALEGSASYSFSYNFAVKNNTPSSHTFNDAIMRIRYPEKGFNDILAVNETQVNIQPFTVGSGETVDYATAVSGDGAFAMKWVGTTISEALYNNSTGIVVYLQLGSGQPVYKMYLRTSENETPEYKPDMDTPIVPEI